MVTEKRNIRPYVLSICFAWGLILGFIVYSTSQSTAEIIEKEQAALKAQEAARQKQLAEERAKSGAAPTEKTKEVSADVKPPIVVPDLTAAQLTPEEDEVKNAAKSKDWRSIPQLAKAVLNPAYGLTARTSPLPVAPERIDVQEIRRRNARAVSGISIPAATRSEPKITLPDAPKTQPAQAESRPERPDLPMPEID